MEFRKFTSIENSYRDKEVKMIQINFPGEEFVVQEKVHGANFSFWTDGETVKCAKRSGFLKEDESFYNHEIILDKFKDKVLQSFKGLKEDKYLEDDLVELTFFGEIHGGHYPHDDVEALPVKTVQKGVYYSNDVEFICFDVKANGKFIGFDKFKAVCMVAQIPFLDEIYRGTFENCLAIGNEYDSTVPALYGLPEIEGNTGEGNVIRPNKVLYFGNGQRVMLKNKNTKFSEKEHTKKVRVPPKPTPAHIVEIQDVALQYLTENRLKNVLSKVGTVTSKEFGKLLGMFAKDAMEDFTKDEPKYLELDAKEKKMVTRLINSEAGNLIRPNFLNIIDGNF